MRQRKKYEYSHNEVKRIVLCQARGMNYTEGWAEIIAERVALACDQWISDKHTVTEGDLNRMICQQLDQLSPELAYALREDDTII